MRETPPRGRHRYTSLRQRGAPPWSRCRPGSVSWTLAQDRKQVGRAGLLAGAPARLRSQTRRFVRAPELASNGPRIEAQPGTWPIAEPNCAEFLRMLVHPPGRDAEATR